jgi:hypothetical protein
MAVMRGRPEGRPRAAARGEDLSRFPHRHSIFASERRIGISMKRKSNPFAVTRRVKDQDTSTPVSIRCHVLLVVRTTAPNLKLCVFSALHLIVDFLRERFGSTTLLVCPEHAHALVGSTNYDDVTGGRRSLPVSAKHGPRERL